MPQPVVLCADDFGLAEGVSRGILELAEAGRLSATGAMTNRPDWRRFAPALRPFSGLIGVGLHLNLTAAAPLGAMPGLAPGGTFPALGNLMRAAFAGRVPVREVRGEIERQLDAFEDALGASPTFVDGHQHVHVLPGIRSALLAVLEARGLQGRVWLRDPGDRIAAILRRGVSVRKAFAVAALAAGFRRSARAAGFETNEGFSGFSPFQAGTPPERVFAQALAALGPRPVVMAHPGYPDAALRALDPVAESREQELAYLRSAAFADLLRERDLLLVPAP